MSMIERYKKKGGFVQLLTLIETSGKEKQEKFLKLIADESPDWEFEIRRKMLTLDKVAGWSASQLMEITPKIPATHLIMIAGGLKAEKLANFLSALPFREKKIVEDSLKEKTPSPSEISTGVVKLFAEIRKMAQDGTLKFERIDPVLAIPDNIEESLDGGGLRLAPMPAEKEVSASPPPAGVPPSLAEELSQLRRKVVQLSAENQRLQTDNKAMRDKLEQIKKIA